jgi:hypothetical protein
LSFASRYRLKVNETCTIITPRFMRAELKSYVDRD